MNKSDKIYMQEAIDFALEGITERQGGPFGAVVVKQGKVVGKGHNRVAPDNDPTAHAEIVAIREACKNLGTFQLTDCILYTTCEPCPMCLGAIYWSRPQKVIFGATKQDAAKQNFDDEFIYREIEKPVSERKILFKQEFRTEALKLFKAWEKWENKIKY